jgi:hypothetical protein
MAWRVKTELAICLVSRINAMYLDAHSAAGRAMSSARPCRQYRTDAFAGSGCVLEGGHDAASEGAY